MKNFTHKAVFFPIFSLLLLSLFIFKNSPFNNKIPPVQAVSSTCSTSSIAMTQTSSPIFYIDKDTTPLLDSGYVSYRIDTPSNLSFTDLWVKADTFSDTTKLKLATNEDGVYHIGSLGTSSTANVYFYLTGATTASAQSYRVHLYEGNPSIGGTELCYEQKSHTSVDDTLQAAANKVNSVVSTAAYIGGTLSITVKGDTGTIGAGGFFNYTPASVSTWPASCYRLRGTSMTLTDGNTGTYTNGLYASGLNSSATSYTQVYNFLVTCVTNTSTAITPLNNIISGGQVKHTAVDTTTYTSIPPISPALNNFLLTKSANPRGSVSGSTVTYYVDIINNGSSATSLDYLKDTLPASPATVSYISSTSTFDNNISDGTPATSISEPTISGQNLTWNRAFSIPANATGRLSYQATIPSTGGSYSNSVVGFIGSTQLDMTASTTDNTPATALYGVGNPNLADTTIVGTDLNGGSLQPGDVVRYTITINNRGNTKANGVNINGTLHSTLHNLTNVVIGVINSSCGTSYSNTSTSTALSVSGVEIDSESACVITFDATVKTNAQAYSTIINNIVVSGGLEGGVGGNTDSNPIVIKTNPNLVVTKTENDADNVVTSNQNVVYTVTITNNGLGNATGVDLTDTPTGPYSSLSNITYSNCGTSYVDVSTSLSINIANLAISTSTPCTITYTLTVSSGAGAIENSADVSTANEGGNNPSAVTASSLYAGGVTPTPTPTTTSTPIPTSTATLTPTPTTTALPTPTPTLNPTSSVTATPTTTTSQITDNDGINEETENGAPNQGDANNDGTPDKFQTNVASFPNSETNKYTTLELGGCNEISYVNLTSEVDNLRKDGSYKYPLGILDFKANCSAIGATATITQYFFGDYDASNYVLRKYSPTNSSYSTITDAQISNVTISGNKAIKVVYPVKDGGELDQDRSANGTIVDPVGLALTDTVSATSIPDTGLLHNSIFKYILMVGIGLMIILVPTFKRYKAKWKSTGSRI
jgi:uncharacterized repeat protein (TIGR01451 family)